MTVIMIIFILIDYQQIAKEVFTTKIGFTSGLSREEYTKLKNLRTERDAYKKPTPFEKQIASYHKKVDAYMRNKGITEY